MKGNFRISLLTIENIDQSKANNKCGKIQDTFSFQV
jgi:hypothetical protein